MGEHKIIRESEDTVVLRLVDVRPELAREMAGKGGDADALELVLKFPADSEVKRLNVDARTATGVITTQQIDRMGDVVVSAGVDTRRAGSVLYSHDYYGLPIGRAVGYDVRKDRIIATTAFAMHDEAEKVWAMVQDGHPFYHSIGFIPTAGFDADDAEYEAKRADLGIKGKPDRVFTACELLEYSVVPVPANPGCTIGAAMKALCLGDGGRKVFAVDGLKEEKAAGSEAAIDATTTEAVDEFVAGWLAAKVIEPETPEPPAEEKAEEPTLPGISDCLPNAFDVAGEGEAAETRTGVLATGLYWCQDGVLHPVNELTLEDGDGDEEDEDEDGDEDDPEVEVELEGDDAEGKAARAAKTEAVVSDPAPAEKDAGAATPNPAPVLTLKEPEPVPEPPKPETFEVDEVVLRGIVAEEVGKIVRRDILGKVD